MAGSAGQAAYRDLRGLVRGLLLRPGDDGYDAARRVWNGAIDRRPMLIVRCAGADDVAAAVRYAVRHGIELSVRSTGHNVTGCAVSDGGLTLDLSGMRAVRVDPDRRTAVAEPGVLWGDFDRQAQVHGLATTGGRISTTGVAGLTLGGGFGWLMRRYGLAADNLRSVDLVTADGRLSHVDAVTDAELFWALRGGGGNFGVATSLEFELHPVGPLVTGGAVFYPAAAAGRVLRWYRDFIRDAPDVLSAQCNLLRLPPAPFVPAELHGVPAVAIAVCHLGAEAVAERDLSALADLGPPLLRRTGRMRYTSLQRLYDMAGRFGSYVYGRAGYLPALDDRAIAVLDGGAAAVPSPHCIVMISPLGGAVARAGPSETAVGHRDAAFSVSVDAVWRRPAEARAHRDWVHGLWDGLRPSTAGVYVNELGDEGPERVRAAYDPASWSRLRAVKARYDPANVFRLNQNIPPAGGGTTASAEKTPEAVTEKVGVTSVHDLRERP
ncbi:FAD-binding oxidoreductase [Couchioplanes azureus]|uniref:FAD-binding oxidoreductase n=1 Tax=Couchioplanes caeruleus TaxID=56438 RepID=UPI0019A60505|nr:FAD-binding oxidoreductase [Couchioplanes caeruleus]GGQ49210.1 FAD-linked oxidase [Couchioplanes caeruleus subsp. azureus]